MILRVLIVWLLLTVLAVIAGAFRERFITPRDGPPGEARTSAQEVDWKVEFVKGRHGGLCLHDGQGTLCRLEITVRDDGTWSAEGVQPPAPATGTTEEGAATRLTAIVEAGWDSLTTRLFTGTCPMAYDGQERYYLVRRLPTGEGAELADADVRELRSCTYDFDHPPARRVLDRVEAEWRALALPGGQ